MVAEADCVASVAVAVDHLFVHCQLYADFRSALAMSKKLLDEDNDPQHARACEEQRATPREVLVVSRSVLQ